MSAEMSSFTVRHFALARALFALVATLMITFTADHSASVGLTIFSGFAIATGLSWILGAWLVFPERIRIVPIALAIWNVVAGIIAGSLPTVPLSFYFAVIIWAAGTALAEFFWGRYLRREWNTTFGRDEMLLGAFAFGLMLVSLPVQLDFVLTTTIKGLETTLTGVTISVGLFGAYAAFVTVFLGISGFSPTTNTASDVVQEEST